LASESFDIVASHNSSLPRTYRRGMVLGWQPNVLIKYFFMLIDINTEKWLKQGLGLSKLEGCG
jgi:hypothetical protein